MLTRVTKLVVVAAIFAAMVFFNGAAVPGVQFVSATTTHPKINTTTTYSK